MSAVSACRMRGIGPETLIAASGTPRVVEDRRGHAGDAELVLLVVGAVAAAADAHEVVLQRLQRGQRLRGRGRQRHAAEQRGDVLRIAPGEQGLARAAGVRGDRAADLGEQAHAVGPGHAVDVDDVAALEHDEVGRLAGLALDRLEVRPGGGPQALEAVLQAAGELEQLVAEQVAPAGGVLRGVTARDERGQQPVRGAGHQTGLGRDVGHAELVGRGEGLEQVERPVERLDALCGHFPQSVTHVPRYGLSWTRTGVPTPTSRPSRTMSALRSRTQPLETRPPISPGSLVPWIASWPPPSQSVR